MPFFGAKPQGIFHVKSRRILPYKFRQIITTGYVAAGYKDSVPWRNVVSMNHATDTTTNRGDILTETANYTSGACGRNVAFVWGTGGVGAFTSTSCFNMRTDSTHTKTTAMNTAYTVGDSGSIQRGDQDGTWTTSYQTGGQGGAFIQKFNLVTEAHQGVISTSYDQGTIGSGAHFDENSGNFWNDNGGTATTGKMKFTFATETQSNIAANLGFHSQQKGQPSKDGVGWAGNEGSYNGGYNYRRFVYATETVSGTMAKPIGNSGEENFDMGQDRGYMLGMYDGAQNNRTWKWIYATNTGSELGASGQVSSPGIAGRSSGHGFWRD
jgi:hypothetical protein